LVCGGSGDSCKANGAAYALREILTYKSDDILGRSAAFDSIVKSEPIKAGNMPATFNVLVRHLRGLGLDVNLDDPTMTSTQD
jgi:DNA-directed RNA polymerase subunit beta